MPSIDTLMTLCTDNSFEKCLYCGETEAHCTCILDQESS